MVKLPSDSAEGAVAVHGFLAGVGNVLCQRALCLVIRRSVGLC